jgi:hypothetical protein
MMGGLDRDGNARKWSLAQKDGEAKAEEKTEVKGANYATDISNSAGSGANSAPEKVHILHTPIAKTHTTFYLGKNSKDIAEAGMEPNTHMFANDNVDTVNSAQFHGPSIPNGSQAGWMAKGRKDISDKDVDEEVHGFASADTNVLPYAWDRSAEAPKSNYMPSPTGSLAQFEGNGGPEKVHFLEPGYMKHLADTNNQYRGNIRTTFYAQQ